LPLYSFDLETAQFKFNQDLKILNKDVKVDSEMSLVSISYETGFFESPAISITLPESALDLHLAEGFKIMNRVMKKIKKNPSKYESFFKENTQFKTDTWELMLPKYNFIF
jgi:hypothetical protein